jgi:hypothetical protein
MLEVARGIMISGEAVIEREGVLGVGCERRYFLGGWFAALLLLLRHIICMHAWAYRLVGPVDGFPCSD